jgi:hypothetical protein
VGGIDDLDERPIRGFPGDGRRRSHDRQLSESARRRRTSGWANPA